MAQSQGQSADADQASVTRLKVAPDANHAGVKQRFRMQVHTLLGPNAYASPHWDDYAANVLKALEDDLTKAGDPESPAYVEFADAFEAEDVLCTDFSSWQGKANPPAPFDHEFGQRLHFALQIVSPDQPFSLRTVHAQWHSGNSQMSLPATKPIGSSYNSQRVGIHYGDDGQVGTADDKIYRAGEDGSLPVHELRYTGVGSGWEALAGDADASTAQLEKLLDATAYNLTQGKDLTLGVTYTVDAAGSGQPLGQQRADAVIRAAARPAWLSGAQAVRPSSGADLFSGLSWMQLSFYALGGLIILAVLGSIVFKVISTARKGPRI